MVFLRALFLLTIIFGQSFAAVPSHDWKWPSWPPLSENVWQSTKADYPDMPEAVVLHYGIRFTLGYTVHFKRILVLSNTGRAAAELQDLSGDAQSFEGRVIQSNGDITQLLPERDLIKTTLAFTKDWKLKRLKVLTPNLSDHCVVDYRWVEPMLSNTSATTHFNGLGMAWKLATTVPIVNLSLFIEGGALTFWEQGFEVNPDCQPKVINGNGFTQYAFTNVPPIRKEPFASTSDLGRPRFSFFYTPPNYYNLTKLYGRSDLSSLKLNFWQEVAQIQYWGALEDGITKSGEFTRWATALCKDLLSDPETKAKNLLQRLQQDVKPTNQLTHAEKALLPKGDLPTGKTPKDLDATLVSGYAQNYGLYLLYYHLLKQAGLNPIIVQTVDRHSNRFRSNQKNLSQFDRMMIGVRNSKGNLVVFDPASRWSAGQVLPAYQGSDALLIITDPDRKKWRTVVEKIPESGSECNRETWTYTILPGEEEESIQIKGNCSGARAWFMRDDLGAYGAQEQAASFKKLLSSAQTSDLRWGNFTLENASSPMRDLSWEGSGTRERTASRTWKVQPFPGLILPFTFPTHWPEVRTQPIQLPYKNRIEAESKIILPKGTIPPVPCQIQHSNSFGEVAWSLSLETKPDGTLEAKVRVVIETKRIQAPPSDYALLKEWIQWVQEAQSKPVEILRGPNQ